MADNNNSFTTAIRLDVPSQSTGVVSPSDRGDFFSFTAVEDGPITIGLFDLRGDIELGLFDGSGNQIAASLEGRRSPELIVFNAAAGERYFIQVFPFEQAQSPYRLVVKSGEPETTRLIEPLNLSEIRLSPELVPFASNQKWVDGQTLGYNLDNLRSPQQTAQAIRAFEQLSNTINLDFVPDEFGVFFIETDNGLGANILGQAEVIDAPFNGIQLISLARSDAVVHEIGHALGLLHPIEDGGGSLALHGLPNTLMRAISGSVAEGQPGGYAALNPTGFLVLDLEYLVEVYGSDPQNLEDNTYIFNTNTAYFEGFHDGGGIDQIVIEDPRNIGVIMNLNPRQGFNFGALVSGQRLHTVTTTRFTILEHVTGGEGGDTITGNTADNHLAGRGGDDDLFGADGADTLSAGLGDDLLAGGNGNDMLIAGLGADTLTGGRGDDLFTILVPGLDDGDALTVITDFGDGTDQLTLVADGISSEDVSLSQTVGGVEISAADSGDVFLFIANQTIEGLEGSILFEAAGSDTLFDDTDGGEDTAPPNPNDLFDGTPEGDTLMGGDGDDTLLGRGGGDSLQGDAGNDQLFGQNGRDTLIGGPDNDTLSGGNGRDQLRGGDGGDSLLGDSGRDLLIGGNGDDILDGGADRDRVNGGNGNDTLIGSAGADRMAGNAGRDLIDYSGSPDSVFVDLANNQGGGGYAEGDQYRRIEDVLGSAFDDTIVGNGSNNRLDGGIGNDSLTGGSGRDIFVASNGDDTIADFNLRRDSLDFSGIDGFLQPDFPQRVEEVESGLLYTLSPTSTLLLIGLTLDDLDTIQTI